MVETDSGRIVQLSGVFISLVLLGFPRSVFLSSNVWLWHVFLSLGPMLGPKLRRPPHAEKVSGFHLVHVLGSYR